MKERVFFSEDKKDDHYNMQCEIIYVIYLSNCM